MNDRLPEAEARRDAMVDAECLTSALIAHSPNPWKVRNLIAYWPEWPLKTSDIHAYDATLAARAAFKAVPALRGEA